MTDEPLFTIGGDNVPEIAELAVIIPIPEAGKPRDEKAMLDVIEYWTAQRRLPGPVKAKTALAQAKRRTALGS